MTIAIGFAGSSGSGKTTLISKIIPYLQKLGHRVAVIKHDGHGHYKEAEGTDSARFLDAGADCTIVSGERFIVAFERRDEEVSLEQVMARISDADIILVEGYKQSALPKIAVMLRAEHIEVLSRMNGPLLAVAAGFEQHTSLPELPVVPWFDSNDAASIAGYFVQLMSERERFHP